MWKQWRVWRLERQLYPDVQERRAVRFWHSRQDWWENYLRRALEEGRDPIWREGRDQ